LGWDFGEKRRPNFQSLGVKRGEYKDISGELDKTSGEGSGVAQKGLSKRPAIMGGGKFWDNTPGGKDQLQPAGGGRNHIMGAPDI